MENKKRILLVEDTVAILKMTQFSLEKAGFEVIAAADGRAALEAVKDKMPDIILLDYRLPDMNGDQVIKHIRSDQKNSAIPIIIFTASLENLKRIKESGATDGVLKPFEPQELIVLIRKYLNSRE